MMSPSYLYDLITLTLYAGPLPDANRAVPLLLGTAIQESGLVHFRQLGGGPARGLWQMEPITAVDHWAWTSRRPDVRQWIEQVSGVTGIDFFHAQHYTPHLQYNIPFGICMARVHYYVRDPARMPAADDISEHARRWKRYYNTSSGKGTEEQYAANWRRIAGALAPYAV